MDRRLINLYQVNTNPNSKCKSCLGCNRLEDIMFKGLSYNEKCNNYRSMQRR